MTGAPWPRSDNQPICVLYVDDYPLDRELVRNALEERHGGFRVIEASTQEEFEARLAEGGFDIVLTDFNILGYEGLQVLEAVRLKDPKLPVVIVTGTGSEEIAVESLRRGATDYVIKSPAHIRRLPDTIHAAMERKRMEGERLNMEEALRETNAALQGLIQASPLAIISVDMDANITSWNRAAEAIFGWRENDVIGRRLPFLVEETEDSSRALRNVLLKGNPMPAAETVWRHKDGTPVRVSLSAALMRDRQGRPSGAMTLVADVTERRNLEDQLRQSQKLEAVGRLAGGLAHDFNNILTAIAGFAELTLLKLPAADPLARNVEEILTAANQASALTRQLMAFSRKQVLEPRVLDLNAVITGLEPMLRRLIGEDVDLITRLEPDLGAIRADPNHVEQIILNLAINAREAMPEGGRLMIDTTDVDLDEAYTRVHVGARPGPHVMLAVSDTGFGMDAETQAHIFEPFFTTKERGRGSGLGLSTVYGIVKQTGGSIRVYSEPSRGTTFRLYFPRIRGKIEAIPRIEVDETPPTGTETVLLVEDDAMVRRVTREMLEGAGYTVIEAREGQEALEMVRTHTGVIDLMITDVVMPRMSGRETADRLTALRPTMKILYVSGYTDDAIVHHGLLEPGLAFLQKPFSRIVLTRKVREVLDQPRAAGR